VTWTAIGVSVFRAWAELSLVGCFHGLFGQPKLRINGPNHRHIVANGAVRQHDYIHQTVHSIRAGLASGVYVALTAFYDLGSETPFSTARCSSLGDSR
jgi:hypothetical protein